MDLIPQTPLFLISENCPRALAAYIICHQCAENDLSGIITRQLIGDKSMSWARFRNDLKSLARQGLLEWFETDKGLTYTLAEYDL